MTTNNTQILRLQGVRVHRPADQGAGTLSLNLSLEGGQFHLVYSRRRAQSLLLGDVCLGLVEPEDGAAAFLDQDWRALGRGQAHTLRGHVGRVMTHGNWIENRSIGENIVLPQRHSTRRSDTALNQEATQLARQFGLPGLPLGYPGACSRADLERVACIRAFMGKPLLVILEHPMELTYPELLPPLINAVQRVRNRGGAVLWLTRLDPLFEDQSLPVTQRHQIVDSTLVSRDRNGA